MIDASCIKKNLVQSLQNTQVMKKLICKNSIFITLVLLAGGCAEDFSGGTRVLDEVQAEEQIAPAPQVFSTRLTNTLLVSGEICRGDETIVVDNVTYECEAKQYLIRIDNVNTCSSAGVCTNFAVSPIIADLVKASTETPNFSVFDIDADSPTESDEEEVIDVVSVKTDVLGNAFVFFKTRPLESRDLE